MIIGILFILGSGYGLVALITLVLNITFLLLVKKGPWILEDFGVAIMIATVSVFLLSIAFLGYAQNPAVVVFRFIF
jgi:hypothetical protein